MKLSIKNRIYLSFAILATLFVINGVIIVVTLNNNQKLSKHLKEVVDPSVQSIHDFQQMLLQSQMYSTNWVFIRSSDEDKEALKKLHAEGYPGLKIKLSALSANWHSPQMKSNLKIIFIGFEVLMRHEKDFMTSLAKFEDYDDIIKKFAAEDMIENDVLPHTDYLAQSIESLLSNELKIKAAEEKKLEESATFMRALIFSLAILIIGLAIFLCYYMNRVIITPIDKIIRMVDDLGKGIIKKVYNHVNEDEIGRMIRSVNILTDNLSASVIFADEIGKRNFKSDYKPLSNEDKLGKALVAMRDNLKSSDDSLNEAQQIAHLGSWERDFKNNKVTWSDELYRIFDTEPSEFEATNENYLNFIHPDDREYAKRFALKYLHDHEPIAYECRVISQKGICKTIYVQGDVIVDEMSEVVKTIGIVQDITARKQAEQAKLESENKYRELFEKMLDGVYKSSSAGKFIEVNPALVKMLGYDSKEELLAIDIKTELYFQVSDRDDAISQNQPDGIEIYCLKKKDGSEIWVEDSSQYQSDENGKVLFHEGILRDVTTRILTEFQLIKSRKETDDYKKALDQSLIVSITDQYGNIKYANDNFCKISKYGAEELIGLNYRTLDLSRHVNAFIKKTAGIITGHEVWRGELKTKTKDGGHFWVDSTTVPFINEDGEPYQYLTISVDITERKAQQEALENSNIELRKTNNELDKFVYSISHDLRAPLLSMLGVVEITEDVTEEEITREHMKMLKGSINRLDKLIGEILVYSRNARNEVKCDKIDFKKVIDEIANDIKLKAKTDKPVQIQIDINGQGTLYSDKERISMVINNLVSNAVNYSNPKQEHPYVKINVKTDADKSLIEVEDNGIGISDEFHQKVFEMFYRCSESSIGSGLGLYIVKETVEKLNGDICLESTPGIGTKFKINVPNLFYQ